MAHFWPQGPVISAVLGRQPSSLPKPCERSGDAACHDGRRMVGDVFYGGQFLQMQIEVPSVVRVKIVSISNYPILDALHIELLVSHMYFDSHFVLLFQTYSLILCLRLLQQETRRAVSFSSCFVRPAVFVPCASPKNYAKGACWSLSIVVSSQPQGHWRIIFTTPLASPTDMEHFGTYNIGGFSCKTISLFMYLIFVSRTKIVFLS